MSEEKTNYMAELDAWIEQSVFEPLYYAFTPEGMDKEAVAKVKREIRQKVLESYRNGQAAKKK